MLRFYTLRGLLYYNTNGFLSESLCFTTMNLLLTRDLYYTSKLLVLMYALHTIVTSTYVRIAVRSRIYFSPVYGFPGVNTIEDKTSPVYDPFESTLTTLVKVSSDVKLEDSGAWINLINLLRHKRSVSQLLERQKANVKGTIVNQVTGKASGPKRYKPMKSWLTPDRTVARKK